jgi:hypothetical protein
MLSRKFSIVFRKLIIKQNNEMPNWGFAPRPSCRIESKFKERKVSLNVKWPLKQSGLSKIEASRQIPITKILFMKTISVTVTVRQHMRSDKWMDTALSEAIDWHVYLNKKYIFLRNVHDDVLSLILNLATVVTTNFWITSP